jgi:hypothetical protein
MAENVEKVENAQQALAKKLDAAGWGAFFIWIGIAFLTNISWGVGLLGVGVIVLAGEAAQRYFSLAVSWFWLMMGVVFVMWGVCESLAIQLSGLFWPILSIAVGLAILITALRPHPRH